MKPVPFSYHRAASIAEATSLLAEDPESRVLAGGQTLMPMLAMRLARPSRVVDITRIPDLAGIAVEVDAVVIGAVTRQSELERAAVIATELPLLARVMPWIGHAATRQRGTIGGSLANADPAAEIALVAVTLGAELMVATAEGHTIKFSARDFFIAPMMTLLPPGGILTAIRFPRRPARQGSGIGFAEMSHRRSDFALAAAAVELTLDEAGLCRTLSVGIGGASDVPSRLDLAGLLGSGLAPAEVMVALTEALAPLAMLTDLHGSSAYRRRAAIALACRAVAEAKAAALGRPGEEAAA